jgi:hypothetical protein
MSNSDQFSKAQSLILTVHKVLKAEELRESKFSLVNILGREGFANERSGLEK